MRTSQPYSTVLVIVTGLLVAYLILASPWLLYAALLVALAGALSPVLAQGIHRGWMLLGWLPGLVVPKVLLALLFYGLLTPLALLSRLLGPSDPLGLRNTAGSRFREVDKNFEPKEFEKPW